MTFFDNIKWFFLLLFIFMKNSSTRQKFMTLIMINHVQNKSPQEHHISQQMPYDFFYLKKNLYDNTKSFFKKQGILNT